eukprot:TRINITY_DN6137_c0_g1_i1.p1 TRINITY_DN6137_c0_g1~~TRINITY_DN6137_c0_g1_i1.p1  ORF type:complete len:924 (+),score=194.42 TRINITY_DN6137_c0_g1_i1:365-3136(+)
MANDTVVKKPAPKKEDTISDEDLEKMEAIKLCVDRIQENDAGVQKLALEQIRTDIKTATSTMTSVPKPLKFLRPHFPALKEFFVTMPDGPNRKLLADILSLLAMTLSTSDDSVESLTYKLHGTYESLELWGHEYVRSLTGEIKREYEKRVAEEKPVDDLHALVDELVPFHMKHHAEPDAIDLLLEVDTLHKVTAFADEENYSRVCNYLLSCANYDPDGERTYRVALEIFRRVSRFPEALRVAIKLNDMESVKLVFNECTKPLVQKQMAFQLARQGLFVESNDSALVEIMSHSKLTDHFQALATDLDVVEPKTAEDIYKSNLEARGGSAAMDSARNNLATTFVNAFVNAAFRRDKLMTEEGVKWVSKNKDTAMMSATASHAMILLWDVEGGYSELDKYLYMNDDNIKAGALLGMGLICSGVRNESDPALALLREQLETATTAIVRTGAITGLGLAYAGSGREDVTETLQPLVEDSGLGVDTVSQAALALGLVNVGTCNGTIAQSIISMLEERGDAAQHNTMTRYAALGLGLLFLARGDAADVTIEVIQAAVQGSVGQYAALTVETCAAAGSGDVLKVQKMLNFLSESMAKAAEKADKQAIVDKEAADAGLSAAPAATNAASAVGAPVGEAKADEEDEATSELFSAQPVAVIAIALIAMGEEIGSEMALRAYDHLLQYGDLPIKRIIPIGLGLLSISHPRPNIADTLSKLSHDPDAIVAQSAIFALGLIGAGTNNSRIAGLLRNLATYYQREANQLFVVRIAQGLLHLGKGTMTLSPLHSERFLLNPTALAGLLVLAHSAFDMKNTLLGRGHFMLYHVVCAMFPRMMMTLDSSLNPLPVSARVGQAVDTVGQAGRPKTITGFQTHTTPVLLSAGERAELATNEYVSMTPVLEGFVIVEEDPAAAKAAKAKAADIKAKFATPTLPM